jgi:hypothetical protein
MTADTNVKANGLLAALPETTLRQWLPLLEAVDLPLGFVLYESGTKPGFV